MVTPGKHEKLKSGHYAMVNLEGEAVPRPILAVNKISVTGSGDNTPSSCQKIEIEYFLSPKASMDKDACL